MPDILFDKNKLIHGIEEIVIKYPVVEDDILPLLKFYGELAGEGYTLFYFKRAILFYKKMKAFISAIFREFL